MKMSSNMLNQFGMLMHHYLMIDYQGRMLRPVKKSVKNWLIWRSLDIVSLLWACYRQQGSASLKLRPLLFERSFLETAHFYDFYFLSRVRQF